MLRSLLAALLCLSLAHPFASASDAPADQKPTPAQLVESLTFQQGKITLPGGIATLDLPANFRYLSPADASRVLVEGWGNPPGATTLGMILPAGVNPVSAAGWGVIVTYDKDGHVKDDDAASIKYDELLKDMQQSVSDNNAERKKAGYPAMQLVGWAEQPSYNPAQHKLYWAKEFHGEGADYNDLNYNIRVLGREGVLVLNAVASMDQIAAIRQEMRAVTAFSDFTEGNRYTDFNDKTDKVAEYGIAALVAGGVAAKLGMFGKLFALLLAFKKIILIGLAGAGTWFYKLIGRRKEVAAQSKVDLSKD
ncbi:DUF2167 domain-containing protein [Oxalobacteraceae bacterium]|nr:DUF2167 domain-containing protein [Oxalobacteraceae bacterium]